ncbi:fusaric acid resistance protein [Mycolicibacterium litorale]|uniref:Fusaric acid resistance protein n=1 Tax=Mycolicibacterium litorale TaxID=758802 RepID=A0A6S6NWP6_9MYCO|nr:FUSC family protein [Mycolicibacterium litorale]BCI50804.1 fusaric acid resistance protein [Mycolicibacterium litorale]
MLTPADLWRRAADRIQTRDPERDALRRAGRAAIVLPIAAAASFAFAGGTQAPMFTIFGSVALLILADFPGNRPARALAYAGLGFNGAVLITLGTLTAPHPWLAVVLMFVLGVAVMFSGVLSEVVAAGQRATLMTFVLPACTAPGPVGERLTGWLIALAVCVPAALFLFPPRHHDDLRRHAATVCRALAECLEGRASTREVNRAMNALWENFVNTDFRPVALTAGSRALVRVVDDLGWLSDRVTDDTGALLGDMKPAIVRVLRDAAAVLRTSDRRARAARNADLDVALDELREIAHGRYREDIEQILAVPDDATAVDVARTLLGRRTFSATVGVTGRIIRNAALADARPVWARVLGRRLPETGAADWVMPETTAVAAITKGFVATRAVVLRNSLRTGLGLALAVTVTHVFPIDHGFWVVLGAMSVLRSSALTTGTRVVRAVAGTALGFLLGVAVIEVVGVEPTVMWLLLPVVAFGSAYVPEIASFIAGQAAFTMMVLIIFNVIQPTGWAVGLVRVEDVVLGALVGATVSLLLWPRGASATVSAAVREACAVGAEFLRAAVLRVTRGSSEDAADRVTALSHSALQASRTLDDSVRQYLSENGGQTEVRAPVVRAANRAVRLRAAAELIADVVPPPLNVYPQTRRVLEAHADLVCRRLIGPAQEPANKPTPPISDDFALALRAETGADDLAISAALPLVTVAANLGELELLYPRAEQGLPTR